MEAVLPFGAGIGLELKTTVAVVEKAFVVVFASVVRTREQDSGDQNQQKWAERILRGQTVPLKLEPQYVVADRAETVAALHPTVLMVAVHRMVVGLPTAVGAHQRVDSIEADLN